MIFFLQLIPLKKCTEWLKCFTYEKYKFDDCCIIESKCILNYCNVYDSMINEVAISSILNILDSVPILKQVIILNFVLFIYSKFIMALYLLMNMYVIMIKIFNKLWFNTRAWMLMHFAFYFGTP